MAPLYDLLCTAFYEDDRLAIHIDDVRRIDRVSGDRLVNEAVGWGLPRGHAEEIVVDLLNRAPEAIESARESIENLPSEIPSILQRQLRILSSGLGLAA